MGSGGKGSRKKQTVGYSYYMAGIFGLCLKATKLLKIVYGERVAWSGSAADGASISVNAGGLYGGEAVGGSGGLRGPFIFQAGGEQQQANSIMRQYLGADCPAHRGVATLTMGSSYVASFSPTFRPLYCLVQNLGYGWYTGRETIAGTQVNPAHEIRDALINPDLSGQYTPEELDDASFRAAADTLYAENFGLSPKWTDSSKAQEYVQSLLTHVDGILVRDRATGKIKLKLNRGGYTVSALPVVDESSFSAITSLGTLSPTSMVNKLTIKYARLTDVGEETATLTGENLANIDMQGGMINSAELEFRHLTDAIPDLPGRILARELRARSYPLRSFTLTGTNALAGMEEGQLFVLKAPSIGIESMVCRILEADYGTLDDHMVTLTVTEDIYGVESASISSPASSDWTSPFSRPSPPAVARLVEMPLYLALQTTALDTVQAWTGDYPYAGFAMSVAKKNLLIDHSYRHQIYADGAWASHGDGMFCESALLQSAADARDTVLSVPDTSLLGLRKGTFGLVDNEFVRIDSWTSTGITVTRGIFDTLPAGHAAGSRLWILDEDHGGVCTRQFARGDTAQIALASVNSLGQASVSTSDRLSLSMQARAFRPYPPAGLSLNGMYLPDTISGPLTVSWKHRDRIDLADTIVAQTDGHVGPEDSTTYSLNIYDENGVRRKSLTSLTGTSWIWDTETEDCGALQRSIRIELWSVRDGYASWQKWSHTVNRKFGDEVMVSLNGVEGPVYAEINGQEVPVLKR